MPPLRIELMGLVVLLSSLYSCSDSSDAAVPRGRQRIVDSSGGTVALGLDDDRPYRIIPVASSGAIQGTISLQGGSRDSAVAVTKNPKVCGDSASLGDATAGGALVWIEGIVSGKPLSEVRRETLYIERCRFEPRLMAVPARSTINVYSNDA